MSCREENKCSCPNEACENHGKCCQCVIRHNAGDSLPYCIFPSEDGDKSNRHYYEVLKERFEK